MVKKTFPLKEVFPFLGFQRKVFRPFLREWHFGLGRGWGLISFGDSQLSFLGSSFEREGTFCG